MKKTIEFKTKEKEWKQEYELPDLRDNINVLEQIELFKLKKDAEIELKKYKPDGEEPDKEKLVEKSLQIIAADKEPDKKQVIKITPSEKDWLDYWTMVNTQVNLKTAEWVFKKLDKTITLEIIAEQGALWLNSLMTDLFPMPSDFPTGEGNPKKESSGQQEK